MSIVNDVVMKLLDTPEIITQVREYLVNRDLAVEIDGKRYQIMTKRDLSEIDSLKEEVKELKAKLFDMRSALWNVLEVCDHNIVQDVLTERWKDIVNRAGQTIGKK